MIRPPSGRRPTVAVFAVVLVVATLVVGILEGPPIAVRDASPVYFVAVVVAGSLIGTGPAIAMAIGAFLIYDFLFTQPRLTLLVSDPKELLDLVLFLALAVIVGRLSALGAERAAEASRRAAESTTLFAISRILATAPDIETAAPQVAERLLSTGVLRRIWIVREDSGRSRVLADTAASTPLPSSLLQTALVRAPGDAPAHWVRTHEPGSIRPPRTGASGPILRVRMETDGVAIGSLRAFMRDAGSEPDRATTRVLALAADQLALAIRRDDLRREATEVEIARRADTLKTALLDAVSHDLRTPLASIRAAAGSLADPEIAIDAESARATARAIDLEAERLDRLVREVLDLSRIEGGSLRPELVPLDLADAIDSALDRLRPLLGDRPIRVTVPVELPPIRADEVLLDGVITNLIENVARHAPAPALLHLSAEHAGAWVRLAVDDAGPGVPAAGRDRLFEKFHRLAPTTNGSRRGLGLGLAIVRGMTEAMGGTVRAVSSALGGLRIEVELPAEVAVPADTPPGEFMAR